MSKMEVKIVTYAVLARFVDTDIAEDYATREFKTPAERENVETTLSSLHGDFFSHLFTNVIPQTDNPSLLYNYTKFEETPTKKSQKKNPKIYHNLLKLNLRYRVLGHTRAIQKFMLDPVGQFAFTASEDSQIKIWHYPTLSLVHTYKGHEEGVTDFDISPDKRLLASISTDQSLRLWSIVNGAAVSMLYVAETGPLSVLKFSPCGRFLAVASEGGNIRIFKITDLPDQLARIKPLLAEGYTSVSIDDEIAYYRDYDPESFLKSPPPIIRQISYHSPITHISFSPGGNFCSLSFGSGQAIVLSCTTSRSWTFDAHSSPLLGTYFFKNNFHMFLTYSGKDGEIKLWNFQQKQKLLQTFSVRYQQRRSHLIDLAMSCDESILYAVTAQMIFAWSIDNSSEPLLHIEDMQGITCVAAHPLLPHVFLIANKVRNNIMIYDVRKSEPIRLLDITFDVPKMARAAWAPNGLSVIGIDAGGGYFVFRPHATAECNQLVQFFPSDFRTSEWKPERGQIEEETNMPIHLNMRDVVVGLDRVIRCDDYRPIVLEDAFVAGALPEEVKAAWVAEESWLNAVRDVKEDLILHEVPVVIPPEDSSTESDDSDDEDGEARIDFEDEDGENLQLSSEDIDRNLSESE